MLRTQNSHPSEEFKPKQCIPITVAVFKELVGTTTQKVASRIIEELAPFPSGSVIHDNACGHGVVTSSIVDSLPKSISDSSRGEEEKEGDKTTIHATDLSPLMVTSTKSTAEMQSWSNYANLHISEMPMQSLTFPPNTFNFSFTNFGIFCLSDSLALTAAQHVHRTLKPGGKAILTLWSQKTPHHDVLMRTHQKTRNTDTVLPSRQDRWHGETFLVDLLVEAGFDRGKVEVREVDVVVDVEDLKRRCEISWSLVGAPEEGWVREDEERWEEALGLLEEGMRGMDSWQDDDQGGHYVVGVNVFVAKK
ncbi:uncharacterized protein PAC_16187 [Phialocephala subalpina]|uniref:Methyltransferase domain-containing protein n=1 Tax=Phialocephala subalpina TaxID=576137 RepID=A0A1L7XMY3_9HELO|nr:uncharacterized protein PAC_16187 [Phialocephala subalpina]